MASLEDLDDNGNVIGKADMFTKRTIRKAQPVDHVDTSVDALAVSMGELGKVDLSYMSRLTGKTENDIVKDLEGIIFESRYHMNGRQKRNIFQETLEINLKRQRLQQSRMENIR